MINHPNRKKIENTLFPGRYNYTGPIKGWFGFLHHEQLCEKSHDVNERIDYVKLHKPDNEVAIRLHNMIYLGGCKAMAKCAPLYADYEAKLAPLDAHHRAKCDALYADYEAKRAVLDADYKAKRAPLYAHHRAKCDALYADYEAKLAVRAKCDALYADYLDADYKAKRAVLDADHKAKCAPLDAHHRAKCDALYADYKLAPLYADYKAKRAVLDADHKAKCAPLDAEILVYIKSNIPDCAWNGKTLVFPCDELPGGNGATK